MISGDVYKHFSPPPPPPPPVFRQDTHPRVGSSESLVPLLLMFLVTFVKPFPPYFITRDSSTFL